MSEPPLRLFLDRSTNGKRFIDGIRRLVDDVETIGDRYGVRDAEAVKDRDTALPPLRIHRKIRWLGCRE